MTGTTGPSQPRAAQSVAWKRVAFLCALVLAATPWSSPAVALTLGCVVALAGLSAYPAQSKVASRQLIQWCVATLGLLMPLGRLWEVVGSGFWLALGTIVGTFALGIAGARMLRVGREQATLVCSGTAVCGGSAIAAVGSSIGASAGAMAIATGAIFLLNAAGLYVLPLVGHALDMSPAEFGAWAGMALHDVASVTGAAAVYGVNAAERGVALDQATVVKLSRVVWIVPIALAARWWLMRARRGEAARAGTGGASGANGASAATGAASGGARMPMPWLIVLFLGASLLATLVPWFGTHAKEIRWAAGLGFQAALFLIGSGLSVAVLKAVGWRVLVLAAGLWLALAGGSLVVVLRGWGV